MIAELLPEGVVTVEGPTGVPLERLLAAEEAALGRVTDYRRQEFTLGRQCGRRALAGLGVAAQPILPGSGRQPVWPNGVVGSITHCPRWCAAAVASSGSMASVGIDIEEHSALPEGVRESIAVPEELEWVERAESGVAWDRLLFSAKECVYKVLFPLTGRWLGFEGARIHIRPDDGSFRAELCDGPLRVGDRTISVLSGRFRVAGGLLATAAWVPAESRTLGW